MNDMSYMFYNASSFDQDISDWTVSNVSNMDSMFYGASLFNQDLSGWNVSNVTDMSYIFFGASSFNQDLCGWGIPNAECTSIDTACDFVTIDDFTLVESKFGAASP